MEIKNFLLETFFPKSCLGCGMPGIYVCDSCVHKIKTLEIQKCPSCKKNFVSGKFCCESCAKEFYFDQLLVCLEYSRGSLFQKLIIRFKYKFSKDLSVFFGDILAKRFRDFEKFLPNCGSVLLVPVPIHKKRLKKRGFNQTKLLAYFLDKHFSKLKICDCLLRNIFHIAQARLSKKERMENLKGAIGFKTEFKNLIKGKTIFLIDDIATTGSTLNECSKILKKNGAKYVCGIVLGRG